MSVLYESMADCVCRCADVYAQLSENVAWRGDEEMSDENGVNDDETCKYSMIRCCLLRYVKRKNGIARDTRIRHEKKKLNPVFRLDQCASQVSGLV
jgi:hypothetical protein